MVAMSDLLMQAAEASTPREQNQRLIAALAAAGNGTEAISAKLDLPIETVKGFLHSKPGIAMVLRLQQSYVTDPQQRVKKMANSALDVLFTLAHTADSDAVRMNCAKDIADRAMGKPVQITENRNINFDVTNIKELDSAIEVQRSRIEKIEQMRKMKVAKPTETISEANSV